MPSSDPTIQRVTAVFDQWADAGRAEGMERGHGPHARQAFDLLGIDAVTGPLHYLDVGCGNGYTVRWAAAAIAARGCGGRAVGLDASGRMIARARERSAGLPVDFVQAPFPDHASPLLAPGRFQAIFSMEVFYYLPVLEAGLAEVARLLAPGGRFACVVDHYAENVASHDWPDQLGVPMTLRDRAGWRAAFAAAGLEVVDQRQLTVAPAPGVAAWKSELGSLLTLGQRA